MSFERHGLLQDEEREEQTTTTDSSALVSGGATPLPWRVLSTLLLLKAVQPLAFEIIFPFVNQMILEIGVVDDPEQVGFYSGLIESIFSCMSFIAGMFHDLVNYLVLSASLPDFYSSHAHELSGRSDWSETCHPWRYNGACYIRRVVWHE